MKKTPYILSEKPWSNEQVTGHYWPLVECMWSNRSPVSLTCGSGILLNFMISFWNFKVDFFFFDQGDVCVIANAGRLIFEILSVLISAEARVANTDLQWVDMRSGVQGTIWFNGCLSPGCMIYPVTIKLVAKKPSIDDQRVLAGVNIMPGTDAFPVDGLLIPNGRCCSPEDGYEIGIIVNYKGDKYPADTYDEYFEVSIIPGECHM